MKPDKLRALRVAAPTDLPALRRHFVEVLGWEETFFVEDPERGAMATFAYGSSAIVVGSPGAFGIVPEHPTRHAIALIEVPHVEQLHAVIAARDADAVGPLSTIGLVDYAKDELARVAEGPPPDDPEHATRYFDVTDPSGCAVRFVQARG